MNDERLRILNVTAPENIRCTDLETALHNGRVYDSIGLSAVSELALKATGIEHSEIHVPVGTQHLQFELSSSSQPDAATFWQGRPVVADCPEQKCGKCVVNLLTDYGKVDGEAIIADMKTYAEVNLDQTY